MKVLILLISLWVIWQSSSRRWRQRLIQPVFALLLGWLLITSTWTVQFVSWTITQILPDDTGEKIDAVVVLGRGEALRLQRAEQVEALWQAGRAPEIFASGMMDARSIVQYLQGRGVPTQILEGEECSQSTEENALFTSAILRPEGVHKILLVTDLPHMMRSLLIFRSFGFTVTPYVTQLPSQWSSPQRMYLFLREFLALAQYSLEDRFKERSIEELTYPPPEVSSKLIDWECRVQG
jgi:uncharacterized SAM-binding protein YcdF (DUF218 family)